MYCPFTRVKYKVISFVEVLSSKPGSHFTNWKMVICYFHNMAIALLCFGFIKFIKLMSAFILKENCTC